MAPAMNFVLEARTARLQNKIHGCNQQHPDESVDLLHECFFEGVNPFPVKPGKDSRRRSSAGNW